MMKFRAYIIAILGLLILTLLFIKSRQSPKLDPQVSENSISSTNDGHNHSHDPKHIIDQSLESESHRHKSQNDLDQTLLAKERFYTESEIQNMNENDFIESLKEIEGKLPKVNELRELPDEALHHTPAQIIQAGREIGLIQEILEIHPNFDTKALEFYEKCIANKETPTPVRALCLTNLIDINNKNGVETPMKKYPQELIDLAKMIIDI